MNHLHILKMRPDDLKSCKRIDKEINDKRAWTNGQWYRFNNREEAALTVATWNKEVVGIIAVQSLAKKVKEINFEMPLII